MCVYLCFVVCFRRTNITDNIGKVRWVLPQSFHSSSPFLICGKVAWWSSFSNITKAWGWGGGGGGSTKQVMLSKILVICLICLLPLISSMMSLLHGYSPLPQGRLDVWFYSPVCIESSFLSGPLALSVLSFFLVMVHSSDLFPENSQHFRLFFVWLLLSS